MSITQFVRPEAKILRVFRIRVVDKPGCLGRLATKLGEMGANIGDIAIVSQGPDFLIRDITLQMDDEKHLIDLIDALEIGRAHV